MEGEGIGLVLARATELRFRISNCIHMAAATPNNVPEPEDGDKGGGEEEMETLLNISDALESLEAQLSSLQTLQQQQRYEKELALAEIENSRKILLDKLKEYKGEDLEVIHEACAFACETVEHSNDLLLPPYPSRPPKNSLHLENSYLPQFPSACKSVGNGTIPGDPSNEVKNISKLQRNQELNGSHGSRRGWGFSISAAGKTVLTLIGVVSVLSLFGFGHNFAKKGALSKVWGCFSDQQLRKRDLIFVVHLEES